MIELLTYSKFDSKEEAEKFATTLRQAGISAEVEPEKNILDKIIVGEALDPLFTVKIASQDFKKAKSIEDAVAETQLENINPDYYLFSFSDKELIQVVTNRDEWNSFDFALAKKLLQQRNVIYVPDLTKKQIEYKPLRIELIWLIVEYLITIYFTVAGVVIGLATFYSYKTLPHGEKVKMYDSFTRNHAKVITVIGILRIILFLYMITH